MAAHYDLNITKGNSFHVRLVAANAAGVAFDLTNWNLRGYAKLRYSEQDVLIDLSPTKVSPYAQGYIDISLPSTFTLTLPVTEGVYDVELYNTDGYVDKIIKGYVRIYPEVTV